MKKATAYIYRDWTYDHQAAASSPWLKTVYRCMAIGIACLLLLLFLPLLNDATIKTVAVVLCITMFLVSLAVSLVAWSKTKSTTLRCTKCTQEMQYKEVDYPVDGLRNRWQYSDILEGDDNRLYCFVGGKGAGWMRFMQGVRTCEQCKRYVIVRPHIHKRIPGGKSDVMHYEKGIGRTQKTMHRLRTKTQAR